MGGNVVYDYVLTEEYQTTSNGAINEYEYEYEDVLDEHGNVVYDYVLTEEYQTTSNGAINQNTGSTGVTKTILIVKKVKRRKRVKKKKACHKRFINQICYMKC